MATPIPRNSAETTARAVAEATGGVLAGDAGARGIVSDTRAIGGGEVFVALRGERHDGHAFLDEAVERGASILVVERDAPTPGGVAVVRVDDTLRAWGALAHAHVLEWRKQRPDGRIVAITGSAGKTTTKQLCAALLGEIAEVHASAGNLNNRVGAPAVLFGLEPKHRFAVVECGMSTRGEIAALADIVGPDVAVITNVSLAHAAGVGGKLEDVAREKGALFDAVGSDGTCVLDADDAVCVALGECARASARKVGFGRSERAAYRLVERTPHGLDGSRVGIVSGTRRFDVEMPFPGRAAAIDLCAALAAAEAAAGPLDVAWVARAIGQARNVEGRATVVRRADGLLILDDSYNANPASMRAALTTLADVTGRRRVAVLGEMKELGPTAPAEHTALGDVLAAAKVELVIGCGGLARHILERARELGLEAVECEDVTQAAREALQRLRPTDVVLVKGSRSVGTEAVVAALRGEP